MGVKLDLTPAVLDLIVYAGDGEDFELLFQDDADAAIDVSALTWTAQIRKTRSSIEASDLVINTDSAVDGIIGIHISDTITRVLSERNQWDLQFTSTDNTEPSTILQGSVKCEKDVTRSA